MKILDNGHLSEGFSTVALYKSVYKTPDEQIPCNKGENKQGWQDALCQSLSVSLNYWYDGDMNVFWVSDRHWNTSIKGGV